MISGIAAYANRMMNRELDVYRPTTTPDGSGGVTVTFEPQGSVSARVALPSTTERIAAEQAGSVHTHNIYVPLDADVRRNDELRSADQTFRLSSVVVPAVTPVTVKVMSVGAALLIEATSVRLSRTASIDPSFATVMSYVADAPG